MPPGKSFYRLEKRIAMPMAEDVSAHVLVISEDNACPGNIAGHSRPLHSGPVDPNRCPML
jgi:hypothetical protein